VCPYQAGASEIAFEVNLAKIKDFFVSRFLKLLSKIFL
jgi:hypothetical protein